MTYIKKNFILLLILIIIIYKLFFSFKKFIKIQKKHDIFPLNPEIYKNFLSLDEVEILLNICKNYNKSTIVNNGKLVLSEYRTSSTCFVNDRHIIYDIIKNKIKYNFGI